MSHKCAGGDILPPCQGTPAPTWRRTASRIFGEADRAPFPMPGIGKLGMRARRQSRVCRLAGSTRQRRLVGLPRQPDARGVCRGEGCLADPLEARKNYPALRLPQSELRFARSGTQPQPRAAVVRAGKLADHRHILRGCDPSLPLAFHAVARHQTRPSVTSRSL
jgi:hypothetical protein